MLHLCGFFRHFLCDHMLGTCILMCITVIIFVYVRTFLSAQEMRVGVQEFVSSLLDHARTSTELEVMLNFNHEPTTDIWMPGQRQTLERLKLAIRYKQKAVSIRY